MLKRQDETTLPDPSDNGKGPVAALLRVSRFLGKIAGGEECQELVDTAIAALRANDDKPIGDRQEPVFSCGDCRFALARDGADGLPVMECTADDHDISADIDPEVERCPGCPLAGIALSWPTVGPESCEFTPHSGDRPDDAYYLHAHETEHMGHVPLGTRLEDVADTSKPNASPVTAADREGWLRAFTDHLARLMGRPYDLGVELLPGDGAKVEITAGGRPLVIDITADDPTHMAVRAATMADRAIAAGGFRVEAAPTGWVLDAVKADKYPAAVAIFAEGTAAMVTLALDDGQHIVWPFGFAEKVWSALGYALAKNATVESLATQLARAHNALDDTRKELEALKRWKAMAKSAIKTLRDAAHRAEVESRAAAELVESLGKQFAEARAAAARQVEALGKELQERVETNADLRARIVELNDLREVAELFDGFVDPYGSGYESREAAAMAAVDALAERAELEGGQP
jgi:hypothetical protein